MTIMAIASSTSGKEPEPEILNDPDVRRFLRGLPNDGPELTHALGPLMQILAFVEGQRLFYRLYLPELREIPVRKRQGILNTCAVSLQKLRQSFPSATDRIDGVVRELEVTFRELRLASP